MYLSAFVALAYVPSRATTKFLYIISSFNLNIFKRNKIRNFFILPKNEREKSYDYVKNKAIVAKFLNKFKLKLFGKIYCKLCKTTYNFCFLSQAKMHIKSESHQLNVYHFKDYLFKKIKRSRRNFLRIFS